MRVSTDERVGIGEFTSVHALNRYHLSQVLQVDLMDYPGTRRHHAQVGERLLRPSQQHVSLAVTLILVGHVASKRPRHPENVHLHRVVNDQIGGEYGADAAPTPPEPPDSMPQ